MSASLVGSEMCIRDRALPGPTVRGTRPHRGATGPPLRRDQVLGPVRHSPVSYTHLTLPTICSV
eukprot:5146168-Alexandrium_andersonii.AAC.1